jgi:hypothetical protein
MGKDKYPSVGSGLFDGWRTLCELHSVSDHPIRKTKNPVSLKGQGVRECWVSSKNHFLELFEWADL